MYLFIFFHVYKNFEFMNRSLFYYCLYTSFEKLSCHACWTRSPLFGFGVHPCSVRCINMYFWNTNSINLHPSFTGCKSWWFWVFQSTDSIWGNDSWNGNIPIDGSWGTFYLYVNLKFLFHVVLHGHTLECYWDIWSCMPWFYVLIGSMFASPI